MKYEKVAENLRVFLNKICKLVIVFLEKDYVWFTEVDCEDCK